MPVSCGDPPSSIARRETAVFPTLLEDFLCVSGPFGSEAVEVRFNGVQR
jgi:hypothetical protein